MLDGNSFIYKSVSLCKFCKPRRKLGLRLTAQRFDLLRTRLRDILVLFLLAGHSFEDPLPAGVEEGLGDCIRYNIRNRHAHPFDGMDAYADAAAARALAEEHLAYFRIDVYQFSDTYIQLSVASIAALSSDLLKPLYSAV